MYMKSTRVDISQDILDIDLKLIKDWQHSIINLMEIYGPDMVLYTKDIDNNNEVKFLITNDKFVSMNIEQDYLEDNCSMTLKQWKECLNSLDRKFGDKAYLYTSKQHNVLLLLAPMI